MGSRRAGVAGALLAAAFQFHCAEKSPPAFERPPAPVVVAAAVERDVPVYLDEVGKCVAREVVSVRPQVSGRIAKIHFEDGADVKIGDMLFTIEPRPFEAELQRAQANLARDTAVKRQAEENLAKDMAWAKNGELQARRYATLTEQGIVSREQYDQVRTEAESFEAAVKADRAAIRSAEEATKVDQATIESARVQLDYCYIRSPINGRAGQRLVDLGNVVTLGGEDPLLVIQRLDPIYADFAVTQNDLPVVRQNMAHGRLRAEVHTPEDASEPRTGDLTFLDNAVQDATGTVKLRATIPNGDRRFWPGQFVKVRLVLRSHPAAVLVPSAAPQMSAQGPFVYVIKPDSTAELRSVTPGQRHGELIVIAQGLEPGERIVVKGQLGVMPGGKVRIEETPVAENASGSSSGGRP
ncbi:MAG: efflux RND transporter periplasmic adaptor subunit [Acidobacteria bacterium]|nr:efflux RND transporter periplasmic adaptor subunit [Acidobacteriota bacterium]